MLCEGQGVIRQECLASLDPHGLEYDEFIHGTEKSVKERFPVFPHLPSRRRALFLWEQRGRASEPGLGRLGLRLLLATTTTALVTIFVRFSRERELHGGRRVERS